MSKIIIADDSSTARMIVKRCMEIIGFHDAEYLEAEDGREVLQIISAHTVNILVTDLTMPNLDGIGLLKEIKSHPEHKSPKFGVNLFAYIPRFLKFERFIQFNAPSGIFVTAFIYI